ncbi:MAG: hypothetical protein N2C14_05745, partial [Planctomycetales bacterium]
MKKLDHCRDRFLRAVKTVLSKQVNDFWNIAPFRAQHIQDMNQLVRRYGRLIFDDLNTRIWIKARQVLRERTAELRRHPI